MFRFMRKWHNKGKSARKMLKQITFFRVSRVPKRCCGIFVCQMLGQTCGTMEEKAGVEGQNSKKGFEKNEHACSVE